MNKARVRIDANVRFHPKVPVITLLRLLHLRIPLTALVFSRARGTDDGGVHARVYVMAADRALHSVSLFDDLVCDVLLVFLDGNKLNPVADL